MIATRVVAPATIDEAIAQLGTARGDAQLLAGGVAWMLQQARGVGLPATLVHLGSIAGLRDIEGTADGGVRIGAMATLAAVARSAVVVERAPGLVEAIEHVGTVRVRNQATIGGNVAAGVHRHDPPVMLLALDAALVVAGPDGDREVPFAPWSPDGADRPAGLIAAIVIPGASARTVTAFHTIRTAGGGHASAGVRLEVGHDGVVADVRLVVADPTSAPRRSERAEAALRGRPLDATTIAEAAEVAPAGEVDAEDPTAADADPATAAGAADRLQLLRTAARRALETAMHRSRSIPPAVAAEQS